MSRIGGAMRALRKYSLVVVFSLVTLLTLCAPREAAMGAEQNPEQATRAAVEKFNHAFNQHDADAVAALLTDDTVFEDTSPAPDGRRVAEKRRSLNSGTGGSRATPMRSSRRKK